MTQKDEDMPKSWRLKITGTIGVIVDAKLKGVIPSIKPVLEEIRKDKFQTFS